MLKLIVSAKSFTLTGPLREVVEMLKLLAQSRLTVAEWLRRANSRP
jgi:hypothetical protein